MSRRRWPIWIAFTTLLVTLTFLGLMFGMFWLLGTVPLIAFVAIGVSYSVLSARRTTAREPGNPGAPRGSAAPPPDGDAP